MRGSDPCGAVLEISRRVAHGGIAPGPRVRRPELEDAGWQRRFVVEPARAEEAAELYREMGLEVRSEPLVPEDFGPDCVACGSVLCRHLVAIYTREAG